ncbi:FecR family protein [Porticoccus sp. GXU_MW_L64]
MNIVDINKSGKRDTPDVTEQAYFWAAKLDGEPSESLLAEFREWLLEDKAHQKEFKRVAAMWDGLDGYLTDLLAQTERRSLQSERHSPLAASQQPRHRSPFRFALAACAFAAISIVAVLIAKPLLFGDYQQTHSTLVGEIKKVDLPDGSDLQLNTNTKAQIDYQSDARLVHLVSGEAHFNVAHQPDKPFIVYAGDVAVKAIGTAFSVYIKDDNSVEVIVSEGTIELAAIEATASQKRSQLNQLTPQKTLGRFSKGQRTLLADSIQSVEKKSEQELTKELSWRSGMLIFDNQPLGEVVDEVSRYTNTDIVVEESIRDMAIGGYFPAGKTDILLSTLEESFDIEVHRVSTSRVELFPKSANLDTQ